MLCQTASLPGLRPEVYAAGNVVRAGVVGDVGKYLSEAAAAIFSPTKSDVDWEGTAVGFSGRITHHEVY